MLLHVCYASLSLLMGGLRGGLRKVRKPCFEAACLQGILVRSREAEWDPTAVRISSTLLRGKLNAFISFLVTGFFNPLWFFLCVCACVGLGAVSNSLKLCSASLPALVPSLGPLRGLVHFV